MTKTVWVKTGTAARMLGVSRMTVIRMCEAGQLRAVRDPRSNYWLIDLYSVQDYLQKLQPA